MEKSYIAIVYYNFGWGLYTVKCKGSTYKAMLNAIDTFKTKYPTVYRMGEYCPVTIEKIVYNYPSGKTYTEKF